MVRQVSAQRVRGAILQHCRSGLGARTLRIAVIEELRRAVDFYGYVWVLTDPVTCVGVDPLADVPGVTDVARTIRLKYATPVNRWTTLTGVAGLGDRAPTSRLWREVQQPLGWSTWPLRCSGMPTAVGGSSTGGSRSRSCPSNWDLWDLSSLR